MKFQPECSINQCFHHCQKVLWTICYQQKPGQLVATVLWKLLWHFWTYVATNHGCYGEWQGLTNDNECKPTHMGTLTLINAETFKKSAQHVTCITHEHSFIVLRYKCIQWGGIVMWFNQSGLRWISYWTTAQNLWGMICICMGDVSESGISTLRSLANQVNECIVGDVYT